MIPKSFALCILSSLLHTLPKNGLQFFGLYLRLPWGLGLVSHRRRGATCWAPLRKILECKWLSKSHSITVYIEGGDTDTLERPQQSSNEREKLFQDILWKIGLENFDRGFILKCL